MAFALLVFCGRRVGQIVAAERVFTEWGPFMKWIPEVFLDGGHVHVRQFVLVPHLADAIGDDPRTHAPRKEEVFAGPGGFIDGEPSNGLGISALALLARDGTIVFDEAALDINLGTEMLGGNVK